MISVTENENSCEILNAQLACFLDFSAGCLYTLA
jgi:hypothetical protein